MALDFYLASTANHLILGTLEPRLTLSDTGLTGILAALREFTGPRTAQNGPCLDEFGTNVFAPADLPALRASLRRAVSHFSSGPDRFQVWVGTEVLPVQRELYQELSSDEIIVVITAIHGVVEEAVSAGAWLFAVGE